MFPPTPSAGAVIAPPAEPLAQTAADALRMSILPKAMLLHASPCLASGALRLSHLRPVDRPRDEPPPRRSAASVSANVGALCSHSDCSRGRILAFWPPGIDSRHPACGIPLRVHRPRGQLTLDGGAHGIPAGCNQGALERSLDAAAVRQRAIAPKHGHIDTPGYKRSVVRFEEAWRAPSTRRAIQMSARVRCHR